MTDPQQIIVEHDLFYFRQTQDCMTINDGFLFSDIKGMQLHIALYSYIVYGVMSD